ncbi:MAG TPA: glycosyltransferase family 9 protein [Edaphobacter sp.]|nr:glycosyltransferase family 9 protein [Edaphobacter sp.]
MSFKKDLLGFSLNSVMATERLLRGRQSPSSNVDSVLILEYMLPLGCCVHLTPVYEAIRQMRPDIMLTVATRGIGLDLLRHNPAIDHLIGTPDPLRETFAAAKALRAELAHRKLRPSCTLTGASDQRSRIALMALLAGAGWRGGFTLAPQLYHVPASYRRDQSLIDNNLQLAEVIGLKSEHYEPRVYFSSADVESAEKLMQFANPEGKPLLVMVTQASGGQRTGWHDERFVQVIRYAHQTLSCAVVYVGTSADSAAVERLRLAAGTGTSLTGQTSVTELAALLAMSDAAVTLDTGTMHIGRAVGLPMVILGPSWQKPLEWLPLKTKNVRILRGEDRDHAPVSYKLDEVQAEHAIEALTDLLHGYPANFEQRQARIERSLSSVDHRVSL